MQTERALRIAPRDFQDYFVQVLVDDRLFDAQLGNISETGLCFLLTGLVDFDPDATHKVEGTIRSRRLPESIVFKGNMVWNRQNSAQGEDQTLCGVHFFEQIDLPHALIALGMSAGEVL
ncbi:MAG: PilZ domain-containing protein [Leptospiraceae bacterium]|nr:PilZ domain-containing protein [Leptospiraceae bacterium]